MKQEHNNSAKKSEPTSKRAKSRGPVQRDTKEVLAELVGKLRKKLDPKVVVARTGEKHHGRDLRPNLDRLTVGVDLQPSIFWAPCAKKITPSTNRRMAVAVSLSVAISLRIIEIPP